MREHQRSFLIERHTAAYVCQAHGKAAVLGRRDDDEPTLLADIQDV